MTCAATSEASDTVSLPAYISSDVSRLFSSGGAVSGTERSTRDSQKVRNDHGFARTDAYLKATPHFKEFLAFLIADVPQVRSVLIKEEKDLLRILIGVDTFDLEVNETIYDREEHIMRVFTNFDFDFHITRHTIISDSGFENVISR